jgi:hypothetical protein
MSEYVGKNELYFNQSLKSDKITLAEEVDSDITDRNSSVDFESD